MRTFFQRLCFTLFPVLFVTIFWNTTPAHAQEGNIQVITSVVDGYGEIPYVKDRLIVGFRDDVPARSRTTLATRFQASKRVSLELINGELWELSVDAGNVSRLMRDLSADPAVAFVQPDIIYQLPAVERNYDQTINPNTIDEELIDAQTTDANPNPEIKGSNTRTINPKKGGINLVYGIAQAGEGQNHADLFAVIPNDSQFSSLWGLRNYGQSGGTAGADISATDAWEVSTGSEDVIIAVLDSGVDYNHPDLNGNMWQDANGNYGYDFVNNDSNPMDTDGHGTHVAGTVAAIGNNGIGVTGVMWNAKIMAVRVCGSFGCPQSAITQGLSYAIQNGAKISNNSYGSSPTSSGPPPAYNSALQNALNNDHLYVVASGNDNNNNDNLNVYPANMMEYFDNVISVGNSTRFDTRSSSSNYGSETVHLFAPGTDIRSTVPGSSYATFSGTSMASPHVAGAAGLLLAAYPNAGYDDLKQWLLDGVDTPSSLDGFSLTNGRMNVFNAISSQNAVISVSPDSLGWMLDAGDVSSGQITVSNNGLNNLQMSVTDVSVNSGASVVPAGLGASTFSSAALDVSFSPEQGFTTGTIHEQVGWTAALGERGSSVLTPHTPLSPVVDDDFSVSGGQSLHLANVSTQINNKLFYAFSPVFELPQQEGATVVEMNFRISNTGGADYGFSLVDASDGSFLATLLWNYEGNLVFSNGGSDLVVGSWAGSSEWQTLKMAYSIGGDLTILLNQQEVWSADAPAGNQGTISQLAIFSDNWHAGETGHFDNVRVYRDEGTPGWLSYTPDAATIPGGGAATVSVSVDAGALSGGIYQRILRFTSNDFATPVVDVLLSLEVMQDNRDYAVTLNVADALPNDINLTIGSAQDATLAYSEQYDRLAPPPPPDGAFDGRLVVAGTSYFEKILPTLSEQNEQNQWEIRFTPSAGNAPVTITWDPSLLPQDDTAFRLTDVVGGLFVDLNMRSTSSLVIEEVFIDKLYLTHAPGGAQIVEQSYSDKWNMVSLPVNQAHDGYSEIFPGTLTESLYSYGGSYIRESTLTPGKGYWLNFTSPQTVTFEGDAVNELVLGLNQNWNLVGGLTVAAEIVDPDGLVVLGSVYRFDGAYIPVTQLEPGLGFWVAASAAGDITLQPATVETLSAGAGLGAAESGRNHTDYTLADRTPLKGHTSEEHPIWDTLNRSIYHQIVFVEPTATEGDAQKVLRSLYFGNDEPADVHPLMMSLPPVPPSGAFDARFEGGRWIDSGNEMTILLQQGELAAGEQRTQRSIVFNPGSGSGADSGINAQVHEFHVVWMQNGLETSRVTVESGESVMVPAGADALLVSVHTFGGEHDNSLTPTNELPSVIALAQNYPNPFNPVTSIRFELPQSQSVSLDVFDMSGRQIATLASGAHQAGSHVVQFDASGLSSGVYLYRLQTESHTLTRKFTLLK